MENWFEVAKYSNKIATIKVTKSTEHFIFVEGGRRTKKDTDWAKYYRTYDEAYGALTRRLENEIKYAEETLAEGRAAYYDLTGIRI